MKANHLIGLLFRSLILAAVCDGAAYADVDCAAVPANYMPTQVFFQADIGSTSCLSGSWLRWANATVDGNKAVFSLLLAAVNSGNRIRYFINNGDTTCQVQFLYAISQ